jgi:hypothetical protein
VRLLIYTTTQLQLKMNRKQPSLVLCIIMDVLGYATYAIPGLGEFADILWAPISALVFFIMFGGWKGALGGMFGFAEEILPGTDFIPTFTIAWLMRYMRASTGPLRGALPQRLRDTEFHRESLGR